MPFLPTELYRPIVDLITDQPTIYALLFVSSVFNYEAERAIYQNLSPTRREIQKSEPRSFAPITHESEKSLFRRLSTCERVARIVLVLEVHAIDLWVEVGDEYWTLLSLALRAVINLKSLTIRSHDRLQMDSLLDGCLFQLYDFSHDCLADEDTPFRFLENQPRIRTLDLSWKNFRNQLSPTALPQLSILSGDTAVIHSLLPGRQVTRLFWINRPENSVLLDLACIGPALKNMRVLKYGGYKYIPRLADLAQYLGKLEVFQCSAPVHKDLIDNASSFSSLQQVILPPRLCDSEFIEQLFANIPTLCFVNSWFHDGAPIRWFRDSNISERIPRPINDYWMVC